MEKGKWLKPPGSRIQHFILKPRDADLAMRHTACGRLFLFGNREQTSRAVKCKSCEGALQ
jgi:hypothetical protein